MFRKILIANRGEIACRIIRTARQMGIGTVAVYSDADRDSLHVKHADEAYRIGASAVSESYLNVGSILDAAYESNADAIHPGYGFLSENPEFAEATVSKGIVFIGPPASAIRSMGMKDAAKALMEKANVPVVPGYHGKKQDSKFLAKEARKIGFPVLVKARSGGGGKGMRRIDGPDEFETALSSAKRESLSSFGDDSCILEKYLEKSRHIEVQVFGDAHGNYVHLFERDCSLQRRHQKVVEEAPAPGLTAETRKKMGDAAVRAAKAIGYQGAGTVEFIADSSKSPSPSKFYFMEMNTRLQVEHPVTEFITGQDLVEWQIRVALGEKLPLKQKDLKINGCAVEARVYAEDPERDFLPATGNLHFVSLPFDIARVDTGVEQGDAITPYYDPMIAKIIVHASTRKNALRNLQNALSSCQIVGLPANIRFLKKLIAHKDFVSGKFDTGLIDRDISSLIREEPLSDEVLATAATASLNLLSPPEKSDPWSVLRGFRTWGESELTSQFIHKGEFHEPKVVVRDRHSFQVFVKDSPISVSLISSKGYAHSMLINDGLCEVAIIQSDNEFTVIMNGNQHDFSIPDPLLGIEEAASDDQQVVSPMPGLVKLIQVKKGQEVEKGQILAVLEAMKMEHTIFAHNNCHIAEILVKEGQRVAEGTTLLKFSETEDAG